MVRICQPSLFAFFNQGARSVRLVHYVVQTGFVAQFLVDMLAVPPAVQDNRPVKSVVPHPAPVHVKFPEPGL
jgi:hypothetical protein